MADIWHRAALTDPTTSPGFGAALLAEVLPGETVLRSWWNIEIFRTDGATDYPPGASILRAGICWAEFGLLPAQVPGPVTFPNADWMAITTINPRIVDLSRATNVVWQIHWGFTEDRSIKSQRKNRSETDSMGLYVSWELTYNGTPVNITPQGWNASIDTLVRQAP